MSSSWFENASVTFMLIGVNLCATLWMGGAKRLQFDLEGLMNGQYSRLLYSKIVFDTMGQAFVAIMMLYSFRQLERQLGSRKFGAFVFLSYILSTLLEIAITATLFSVQKKISIENGPYFLVFSLLPMFYWYIPKLYGQQSSVMGMSFPWSEKSYIYLLAIQLCLNKGLSTILPCVIGLGVGLMYNANILNLQAFRLPSRIENLCGAIGGIFTSLWPSSSTPTRTQQLQRQRMQQRAARRNGNATRLVDWDDEGDDLGNYGWAQENDFGTNMANLGQPQLPLAPPSDEAITTLMGMGFDREAVIQALRTTNNNVEAAANILLR